MSDHEASLLSGSRGYFAPGETIPGTKLRIERSLGSGGQGEVHLVVNQVSKQRQVIKLLHPELVRSEAAMARFEKEVQLMAMLAHPNIVKLLHTDVTAEAGGRPALPYLLMEHLEGETLAGFYASGKTTFGRRAAVHLFSQIADALDYAASSFGLVHRDLKPANLFFAVDTDGRTSAKVLDFGISQLCEALTSVTSDDFLGTEAYAAPEQYSGRTSPKTDVYQLGIVIWEAFAGHHPFHDRTTRQSLMYAQLETIPPPLASTIANCPRSLSKIVEAMLDKDPRRRPSMDVVKNTLQDLAKDPDLRQHEAPIERVSFEAEPNAAADVFKAKTRISAVHQDFAQAPVTQASATAGSRKSMEAQSTSQAGSSPRASVPPRESGAHFEPQGYEPAEHAEPLPQVSASRAPSGRSGASGASTSAPLARPVTASESGRMGEGAQALSQESPAFAPASSSDLAGPHEERRARYLRWGVNAFGATFFSVVTFAVGHFVVGLVSARNQGAPSSPIVPAPPVLSRPLTEATASAALAAQPTPSALASVPPAPAGSVPPNRALPGPHVATPAQAVPAKGLSAPKPTGVPTPASRPHAPATPADPYGNLLE